MTNRESHDAAAGSTLVKAGAKLTEQRLSNGLRVILAERHSDPVVAVMLWYRVGARNESEREAGVSHFLEHMMFKGSQRFGKGSVDRMTTEKGGSNNAFTSYDHTAYWFELASDRWEQALEIEADRMRHLLLDAAEFASEREVVLEELNMGMDEPWRALADRVQAAVFPRHPYRRPIIGYVDTLRGLDVTAMRDYYERFYHPGNALLVLAGDLEPSRALAVAERHLGSTPLGRPYAEADTFRPAQAWEESARGEQRVSMSWDDQGKRLCLAWPTASVGSPDHWSLELIAVLLTGGRTSRLVRKFVLEQGLAMSVSAQNDTRIDGGIFWLFAECAQGTEPAELERALDAELTALTQRGATAEELARVKQQLAASEAHDWETASDLAEEIGSWATDADWRLAVTGLEQLLAVDAARIKDCAARLLARDRRVVGWSLPKLAQTAPRAGAKPRQRRNQGRRAAAKTKSPRGKIR
jgi:zinc protease